LLAAGGVAAVVVVIIHDVPPFLNQAALYGQSHNAELIF
jgi:hypothetical protein